MPGSFGGLEIGLRALQASRLASELAGHNIANANTDGFTRQQLSLVATPPFSIVPFNNGVATEIGSGVDIAGVRRYRDDFIDIRFRAANQEMGRQQTMMDSMQRLEAVVNEPSDGALSSLVDAFFGAWHDVANDPSSLAARSSLTSKAQVLTARFNQLAQGIQAEQANMDNLVTRRVADINSLATQIAGLNQQIMNATTSGAPANDLTDKRDLLLDQLSKIVNITYTVSATNVASVSIGVGVLVNGLTTNTISSAADPLNNNFQSVTWTAGGAPVAISSGELQGAIYQRDTALASRLTSLNALAAGFISSVNAVHALGVGLDGVTGRDFFTGADATDIGVNPVIVADANRVGAAANQATLPAVQFTAGDNTIALQIGNLADSKTMAGGTATFNTYWNTVVAQLGVESRQARNLQEGQQLVLIQLTDERSQQSGVSIDEEAANLVRFQRTYEAAARIISVMDGMLDKVINEMGR